MDKRYIAVYLLSAVCVYFGVDMMVSSAGDDAPSADDPSAASIVEIDPAVALEQGASGYMGTGRPQITLVEAPVWPDDQVAPRPIAEMDPDRAREGDVRSEDLSRVLENLGGMDVYVEGVDGPSAPAPSRGR